MQMGDYEQATTYFKEAIKNMQKNVRSDGIEDIEDKPSDMKLNDLNELAINRFILATRYFQNGMAHFEMVKSEYPVR